MTISFPTAFPTQLPISQLSFRLAPVVEVSPLRSGRRITKDLGPPLWHADWKSDWMEEEDAGPVRAWRSTVLSENEFYAYDVSRQYPIAYKNGWGGLLVSGSPFNGRGKIASVTSNLVMGINFLPIGLVLTPGDYLAFDYSTDLRALHMVVAGGVANGSGLASVEVRPHVRPGWTVATNVDLYRPSARMLMIPDSWDEQIEPPNSLTVGFSSVQSL